MAKKNIENKELDLILINDNFNYYDFDFFKNLKKENIIICICNNFNSKQLFNLYIKDLNINLRKLYILNYHFNLFYYLF